MALLLHLMLTHNEIPLFHAGSCYQLPFGVIRLLLQRCSHIRRCNIKVNGALYSNTVGHIHVSFWACLLYISSFFLPLHHHHTILITINLFYIQKYQVLQFCCCSRRDIPQHFHIHFIIYLSIFTHTEKLEILVEIALNL